MNFKSKDIFSVIQSKNHIIKKIKKVSSKPILKKYYTPKNPTEELIQNILFETIYRVYKINKNVIIKGDIFIDVPKNIQFGQYSTNISFKLQSVLQKPPLEIANNLAKNIKSNEIFEKIEAIKPGYINFFLKQDTLIKEITKINSDEVIKKSFDRMNAIFEYTDPNPFKLFHIGHLFTNFTGQALSNIYEYLGANVKRANYQGDVGMHVAKSIYGIIEKFKIPAMPAGRQNSKLEDLEKLSLVERIEFMGKGYALGNEKFENDEKVKLEIKILNTYCYLAAQETLESSIDEKVIDYKHLIENFDERLYQTIKNIYIKGRKWSLEYFETIYSKLHTKFNFYFFESQVAEHAVKILNEQTPKVFKKDKGAIIFEGSKYGLHNRVFMNSRGLPTYEAKDLALPSAKYDKFKYDKSFIITAKEINEYFQVVLTALSLFNPELAKKTIHLGHGLVKLSTGKMSSRKGNIIGGEDLLNMTKLAVLDVMKNSKKVILNNEKIAEMVALAAIKYAFLKVTLGLDVIYDIEKSISFEGNTGPYLLYTYVRCLSIIKKSKNLNFEYKINYKFNDDEKSLIKQLGKFHEIVLKSANDYQPSYLCNYLFTLCQNFNSFYQKYPILTDINAANKLEIIKAISKILIIGCKLLGFDVVEQM